MTQELYSRIEPLMQSGDLRHVIIATYSDYLRYPTDLAVPEFIAAPRMDISRPGAMLWCDVLRSELSPGPLTSGPMISVSCRIPPAPRGNPKAVSIPTAPQCIRSCAACIGSRFSRK